MQLKRDSASMQSSKGFEGGIDLTSEWNVEKRDPKLSSSLAGRIMKDRRAIRRTFGRWDGRFGCAQRDEKDDVGGRLLGLLFYFLRGTRFSYTRNF